MLTPEYASAKSALVTHAQLKFVRSYAVSDEMDTDKFPLMPGTPRYDKALALEDSVRVIRRASGKRNPEECVQGTPEWEAVIQDFLKDLLWASGSDADDHYDDLR